VIDVAVEADGSGTVTVTTRLDAEAAAKVPDLDQSLLVEDLKAAGWRMVGPDRLPDGGWEVSAAKRFTEASRLGSVLAEVAGRDGPFRDFRLDRSHSFAKTSYRLEGTVDLSGGIEAFGDPELRQALGGNMFGRPLAELELAAGKPLDQAVRFTVRTHLPGGGTDEWEPKLGAAPTAIEASSANRAPTAWLFGFTALLALAGFVVTVLLIARYNRIRRPPAYVHRPGGNRRPWDD